MGRMSSNWSSAIPDIPEAPVLSLLRLEAEAWLVKDERPPLLWEAQPLSRLDMEVL